VPVRQCALTGLGVVNVTYGLNPDSVDVIMCQLVMSAGPAGTIGAPGFQGNPGPQGNIGASGRPGAVGQVGSIGQPGQGGQPGSVGPSGQPGAPGPAGQIGNPGPVGQPGPSGPSGFSGQSGITAYLLTQCNLLVCYVTQSDMFCFMVAIYAMLHKCIIYNTQSIYVESFSVII